MSKIVKTIEAYVGETVRIRWRKHTTSYVGDGRVTREILDEILIEDHTAPPADTWKA